MKNQNTVAKSKEQILDECGVRIFGAMQARILEAMEYYANQKLIGYRNLYKCSKCGEEK